MVLKINQTYQPFVNSEECVGEKNADREGRNVKKKERSIPHCFRRGMTRASHGGRDLLCPPLKKSLSSEQQVAQVGFRMCGCALAFGSESL